MGVTQREIAAHHESGHAVTAYLLGRPIRIVRLEGEGKGGLHCAALREDAVNTLSTQAWRQGCQEEALICLSGPYAEERFSGSFDAEACEVDFQMARRWVDLMDPIAATGSTRGAWLLFTAMTRELLAENWSAVSRVAKRLIKSGSMTGREVETLCRGVLPKATSFAAPCIALRGSHNKKHA